MNLRGISIVKLRIAAAISVAAIYPLLTVVSAHATQQPYGGCAEAWQAPRSSGAEHCRDLGWTVNSKFVVGPHGWLRATNDLAECRYEDGYPFPCITIGDRHRNHKDAMIVTGRPHHQHFMNVKITL